MCVTHFSFQPPNHIDIAFASFKKLSFVLFIFARPKHTFDIVEIGQPIGVLRGQDEWAHVHMTVKQSNSQPEIWLCPMDYMSLDELDDLAEPTQAWADRLYQGAKTPEFCNT